jgi:hypothetical protein
LNRKPVLAMCAAVAVAALAWDLLREPAAAPGPAQQEAGTRPAGLKGDAGGALPLPELSFDPRRVANPLRPHSVTHAAASHLLVDFTKAAQLKPLYDRLKNTPDGETAEGQFLLYRILRACATVADRKGPAPVTPSRLAERRDEILASLPEGDPRRAQRSAAFERITADQCVGLGGITMTEADLAQMLRNAVAGGDPKARAWQVEQDMLQERRSAAGQPGRSGPTLSDPQLDTLRSAIASKDPEAMVIAGRVLASPFRDMSVRVDQEPVENRVFANAWQLLACEYGYPCDENNARVLNGCAFQGHCGVASYPDYLFYYGSSPYDAQLLDRYRTILRQAVDSGDWTAINIQRGAAGSVAGAYLFSQAPRR